MAQIRSTLALSEDTRLIPFSAEKGTGRDALVKAIMDVCDERKKETEG